MTLPDAVVIALNVVLWPVIHVAVSAAGVRAPADWFEPHRAAFRLRGWERRGSVYETLFAVRRWKHRLPEGASLLRGAFTKGRLRKRSQEYLEEFAREASRGEAVHWVTFAFAPVFFLWNPAWAGWVMVAYATVANIPCIIAQRYNRARILAMRTPKRIGG